MKKVLVGRFLRSAPSVGQWLKVIVPLGHKTLYLETALTVNPIIQLQCSGKNKIKSACFSSFLVSTDFTLPPQGAKR